MRTTFFSLSGSSRGRHCHLNVAREERDGRVGRMLTCVVREHELRVGPGSAVYLAHLGSLRSLTDIVAAFATRTAPSEAITSSRAGFGPAYSKAQSIASPGAAMM